MGLNHSLHASSPRHTRLAGNLPAEKLALAFPGIPVRFERY